MKKGQSPGFWLLSAIMMVVMIGFAGCVKRTTLEEGPWLGVIAIDSADHSLAIPFTFNYTVVPGGESFIEVSNAGEIIQIHEYTVSGDTFTMKFPVFSAGIVAVLRNDSMVGSYYPKGIGAGTAYRFYALKGVTDRFPWFTEAPSGNVSGRWRVVENPGSSDSAVMVGEFLQEGSRVTGTVLSTGGDYRYLEGKVAGNRFMVSAVDGAHSLVLTAEIAASGSLVNGRFLGSPGWRTTWRAERNDTIRLPKTDALVKVKPGAPPFAFSFPDFNGDTVSLSDPRFFGKVVIVQAAGTWCPNCMDEAVFFSQLYEKCHDKGLEIVALCFEDKTFTDSKPKMERFALHTEARYPFLYAGPRGRGALAAVFYNLEGPMAYPTTQFIDRKGAVRRVETGFTGPGTGDHYLDYTAEITQFVEELLAEK